MTYLYMGCCGGVMGHHAPDCEDLAEYAREQEREARAYRESIERDLRTDHDSPWGYLPHQEEAA